MGMQAAVIERFSEGDPLFSFRELPIPVPGKDEILIRVRAASVNPIETMIRQGYGDPVFRRLRGRRFPFVLGLDCAGTVVDAGSSVHNFAQGERVWTALRPDRQGSNAEYIAVPAKIVAHAPHNLDLQTAAALPYVTLTAWRALHDLAGLNAKSTSGKKVLVHAGAGGIGHVAIQMLKAWGAEVATTCSTRNVDLVRALGADHVVNYEKEDFSEVLRDYDVVLNTLVPPDLSLDESRHLRVLKRHGGARYVTLITPLLHFIGEHGLIPGAVESGALYAFAKSREMLNGRRYYWALFEPNATALAEITAMVESEKIIPLIENVFPLWEIADAHRLVETGRVRGKVLLDIGRDD